MIGLSHHSSGMASTSKNPRPQLFRSIHIYAVLLLLALWTTYSLYNSSTMSSVSTSEQAASNATPETDVQGGDHYQGAATPEFTGMIRLHDLPAQYMPEIGKHRKEGRLVVVGDVHGMKDSLEKLLKKLDFDKHHDHLILAGDMIAKGPDSAGVVDLAMKYGATGVRGNHEDRVLGVHAGMIAEHVEMASMPDPNEDANKAEDLLEELSYSHGDYKDRALVRVLGEERIKWLKKCPVILRVGSCGSMGEVVVVHAGLAPGVKLEKQDATMVMNMRTIGEDGMPSDGREGTHWQKAWNKYQKHLPKHQRSTVIYGHDSKRGLQLEKYSMGVDTSCLKGGRLTAVVIEGAHSDYKHSIVSVGCPDGRS